MHLNNLETQWTKSVKQRYEGMIQTQQHKVFSEKCVIQQNYCDRLKLGSCKINEGATVSIVASYAL